MELAVACPQAATDVQSLCSRLDGRSGAVIVSIPSGFATIARDDTYKIRVTAISKTGKVDRAQTQRLVSSQAPLVAAVLDDDSTVLSTLTVQGQLSSTPLVGGNAVAFRSIPLSMERSISATNESSSVQRRWNDSIDIFRKGCSSDHTLFSGPGARHVMMQLPSWRRALLWKGSSWDDPSGSWCRLPPCCSSDHAGLRLVTARFFSSRKRRARKAPLGQYSHTSRENGSSSHETGMRSFWGNPSSASSTGSSTASALDTGRSQDHAAPPSYQEVNAPLAGPAFGGFPGGLEEGVRASAATASSTGGISMQPTGTDASSGGRACSEGSGTSGIYGNVHGTLGASMSAPVSIPSPDHVNRASSDGQGTHRGSPDLGEGDQSSRALAWTRSSDVDCIALLHASACPYISTEDDQITACDEAEAEAGNDQGRSKSPWMITYRITVVGIPECMQLHGIGEKCVLASMQGTHSVNGPVCSLRGDVSLDGSVACIGVETAPASGSESQGGGAGAGAGTGTALHRLDNNNVASSQAGPRSRRRSGMHHHSSGTHSDPCLLIRRLDRPDHVAVRLRNLGLAGTVNEDGTSPDIASIGAPAAFEFAASSRVVLSVLTSGHLLACTVTGMPLRLVADPTLLRQRAAFSRLQIPSPIPDQRGRDELQPRGVSSPFLLDLSGRTGGRDTAELAPPVVGLAFSGHRGSQLVVCAGNNIYGLRLPAVLAATVCIADRRWSESGVASDTPPSLQHGNAAASDFRANQVDSAATCIRISNAGTSAVRALNHDGTISSRQHTPKALTNEQLLLLPRGRSAGGQGQVHNPRLAATDSETASNEISTPSGTGIGFGTGSGGPVLDWASQRVMQDSEESKRCIEQTIRDPNTLIFLAAMISVTLNLPCDVSGGLRPAPDDGAEAIAVGLTMAGQRSARDGTGLAVKLVHLLTLLGEVGLTDPEWELHGAGDGACAALESRLVAALSAVKSSDLSTRMLVHCLCTAGAGRSLLEQRSLPRRAHALTDEGLLRELIRSEKDAPRAGGATDSPGSDARPFEGVGALWRASRAVALIHADAAADAIGRLDGWTHSLFQSLFAGLPHSESGQTQNLNLDGPTANVNRYQETINDRDQEAARRLRSDRGKIGDSGSRLDGQVDAMRVSLPLPLHVQADRAESAARLLRMYELIRREQLSMRPAVLMAASGRADAFAMQGTDAGAEGAPSRLPLQYPIAWLRLGRATAECARRASGGEGDGAASKKLALIAASIHGMLQRKTHGIAGQLNFGSDAWSGQGRLLIEPVVDKAARASRHLPSYQVGYGLHLGNSSAVPQTGSNGRAWVPPHASRLGIALGRASSGHALWSQGKRRAAMAAYTEAGVIGLPCLAAASLVSKDWVGALAAAAAAWPLSRLDGVIQGMSGDGAADGASGWSAEIQRDIPLADAEAAAVGMACRQCCAIVGASVSAVFASRHILTLRTNAKTMPPVRSDSRLISGAAFLDGRFPCLSPLDAADGSPVQIAETLIGLHINSRLARCIETWVDWREIEASVAGVPDLTPALGMELLLAARCDLPAAFVAVFSGGRVLSTHSQPLPGKGQGNRGTGSSTSSSRTAVTLMMTAGIRKSSEPESTPAVSPSFLPVPGDVGLHVPLDRHPTIPDSPTSHVGHQAAASFEVSLPCSSTQRSLGTRGGAGVTDRVESVPASEASFVHCNTMTTIMLAKAYRVRLHRDDMFLAFAARLSGCVDAGSRGDTFALISIAGPCVGRRDHELRMQVLKMALRRARTCGAEFEPPADDARLAVELAGTCMAAAVHGIECNAYQTPSVRQQAIEDAQKDCREILENVSVAVGEAAAEIASRCGGDTAVESCSSLLDFGTRSCGRIQQRHRGSEAAAAIRTVRNSLAKTLSVSLLELEASATRRGCIIGGTVAHAVRSAIMALGTEALDGTTNTVLFPRLALAMDVLFICARGIGTRGLNVLRGAARCLRRSRQHISSNAPPVGSASTEIDTTGVGVSESKIGSSMLSVAADLAYPMSSVAPADGSRPRPRPGFGPGILEEVQDPDWHCRPERIELNAAAIELMGIFLDMHQSQAARAATSLVSRVFGPSVKAAKREVLEDTLPSNTCTETASGACTASALVAPLLGRKHLPKRLRQSTAYVMQFVSDALNGVRSLHVPVLSVPSPSRVGTGNVSSFIGDWVVGMVRAGLPVAAFVVTGLCLGRMQSIVRTAEDENEDEDEGEDKGEDKDEDGKDRYESCRPPAWLHHAALLATEQGTWGLQPGNTEGAPMRAVAPTGRDIAEAAESPLASVSRATAASRMSPSMIDAQIAGIVCPAAVLTALRGADESALHGGASGASAMESWIQLALAVRTAHSAVLQACKAELQANLAYARPPPLELVRAAVTGAADRVGKVFVSRLADGTLFRPWWESDANIAVKWGLQRKGGLGGRAFSAAKATEMGGAAGSKLDSHVSSANLSRSWLGQGQGQGSGDDPVARPRAPMAGTRGVDGSRSWSGSPSASSSSSSPGRHMLPRVPEGEEEEETAEAIELDLIDTSKSMDSRYAISQKRLSGLYDGGAKKAAIAVLVGEMTGRSIQADALGGIPTDDVSLDPSCQHAEHAIRKASVPFRISSHPTSGRHDQTGDEREGGEEEEALNSRSQQTLMRKRARDRAAAEAAAKHHAMHVLAPTTHAQDVDEMASAVASLADDSSASAMRSVGSWHGAPQLDDVSEGASAGLSAEEARDIDEATETYHRKMREAGRVADSAAGLENKAVDLGLAPSMEASQAALSRLERIRAEHANHQTRLHADLDPNAVGTADGSAWSDDEHEAVDDALRSDGSAGHHHQSSMLLLEGRQKDRTRKHQPRLETSLVVGGTIGISPAGIAPPSPDADAGNNGDGGGDVVATDDAVPAVEPPHDDDGSAFKEATHTPLHNPLIEVSKSHGECGAVPHEGTDSKLALAQGTMLATQVEQATAAVVPASQFNAPEAPGSPFSLELSASLPHGDDATAGFGAAVEPSHQHGTESSPRDEHPTRRLPPSGIKLEGGTASGAFTYDAGVWPHLSQIPRGGTSGSPPSKSRSLRDRIRRGEQLKKGPQSDSRSPGDTRAGEHSTVSAIRRGPDLGGVKPTKGRPTFGGSRDRGSMGDPGPLAATMAAAHRIAVAVHEDAGEHPSVILDGWEAQPLQTMPAAARRAADDPTGSTRRPQSRPGRREDQYDQDVSDSATPRINDSSSLSMSSGHHVKPTMKAGAGAGAGAGAAAREAYDTGAAWTALNPRTGEERASASRDVAATRLTRTVAGDPVGPLSGIRLLRLPRKGEHRTADSRDDAIPPSSMEDSPLATQRSGHDGTMPGGEYILRASHEDIRSAGASGISGSNGRLRVTMNCDEGVVGASSGNTTVPGTGSAHQQIEAPAESRSTTRSARADARGGEGGVGGFVLLSDIDDEADLNFDYSHSHVHDRDRDRDRDPHVDDHDAGRQDQAQLGPGPPGSKARIHPGREENQRDGGTSPDVASASGSQTDHTVPSQDLRRRLEARDGAMGTPTAELEAAEAEELRMRGARSIGERLEELQRRAAAFEAEDKESMDRLGGLPESMRRTAGGSTGVTSDEVQRVRLDEVRARVADLGQDVDAELGLVVASGIALGSKGGSREKRHRVRLGPEGAGGQGTSAPEAWEADLAQAKELMEALEREQLRGASHGGARTSRQVQVRSQVALPPAATAVGFDLGGSAKDARRSTGDFDRKPRRLGGRGVPRVSVDGLPL